MTRTILLIAISVLIFFHTKLFSQKNLISDYDAVLKEAKLELDSLIQPTGALQLKAAGLKLKGEYIMDLTIFAKGKILSVYMVSSDADDVKQQNLAKDLVRTVEFNFKVPRDKTYKFQYTFVFK